MEHMLAGFFDLDNCLFDTSSMSRSLFDQLDPLFECWLLNNGEADEIKDALWSNGAPQDVIPQLPLSAGQKAELMAAYDALSIPRSGKLYDDVLPFLKRITALPNRPTMILVTRGLNGFQSSKIAHLGIADYFDYIQIVGDDRWSVFEDKGLAFDHFRDALDLGNDECFVVGDSVSDELAAGDERGMLTMQTVRPGVKPRIDGSSINLDSLENVWQHIGFKTPQESAA